MARTLLAALPAGATLVVSSSMPVRDVEWYGRPRDGVRVLANRGANGIDGVVSTAVGVALGTGGPTALLIGDVALLHDTNGLLGAAARAVDLTIVCVDNDGGGIFSFLPQAGASTTTGSSSCSARPTASISPALAAVHGVRHCAVGRPGVAPSRGVEGVRLVHVRTERRANVAVHDEIHRAVSAAL